MRLALGGWAGGAFVLPHTACLLYSLLLLLFPSGFLHSECMVVRKGDESHVALKPGNILMTTQVMSQQQLICTTEGGKIHSFKETRRRRSRPFALYERKYGKLDK
jgi:hypothetical protein